MIVIKYLKKISLLIIICVSNLIFAQPNIQTMAEVTSPPIVAGLFKNAKDPIDYYNGRTIFTVPLYEFNYADINLPLLLNYANNGLRVDEEASNVGLGWTTNTIGVIQEISNTDENDNLKLVPRKSITEPNNTDQHNLIEACGNFYNESGSTLAIPSNSSLNDVGFRHKIYNYNFAGYSGKFIQHLEGANSYITTDNNNLVIENLLDAASGNYYFKITAPDGSQYYFNLTANNYTPKFIGAPCQLPTTALNDVNNKNHYLTKIISPNNNILNFEYESPSSFSSIPQLLQWKNYVGTPLLNTLITQSRYQEYALKRIYNSSVSVEFVNSLRQDVPNSYEIDQINLYNTIAGKTLVKKITFSYGYFGSDIKYGDFTNSTYLDKSGCYAERYATGYVAISESRKNLRLKLLSVVFSGNLGYNSTDPKYIFDYDSTPMPYKTSLAKDLWGYFNGVTTNKTLLPDYTSFVPYFSVIPTEFKGNSNRLPDSNFIKAGILNKITYPTGGFKVINYEINQPGSGLRVKSIEEHNSDIEPYKKAEFAYLGGRLLSSPLLFRATNYFDMKPILDDQCSLLNYNQFIFISYLCLNSGNSNGFSSNNTIVGYDQVEVTTNQVLVNGTIKKEGKEIYKYLNYDYSLNYQGIAPIGLVGNFSLKRGLLNEKNYQKITSSGVFYNVKSEKYDYDIKNFKNYWNYFPDKFEFISGYSRTGFQLFIHFDPISTGNVLLTKKTDTNYNTPSDMNLVSSVTTSSITSYFYNTKNQLSNQQNTTNNGDLIEQKKYFANDLNSGVITNTDMPQLLVNANKINVPIKTETIKNGKKICSTETKYFSSSGLILPKEFHSLKGSITIDTNNSNTRKLTIDYYDTYGNVTQSTQENGIPISYIWAYNSSQIVAKLINVKYSDIPLSLISNIQGLSLAGVSNENTLITYLNNLRTTFPDALITTYTYKALAGVSTITDSRGQVTTYLYDVMGRLQFVKDAQGNVLTENEYNNKQ